MRTSDFGASVAATFKGRTMARSLINNGDETSITLSGATALRGDIMLTACVGGSGCTGSGIPTDADKIKGMISNLEELRHDGAWVPYNNGSAVNIPMLEGDIAADGSFGGRLDHPQNSDGTANTNDYDNTVASKYGGNLYGPEEAAGWWHVQADNRERARRSSIIGSFGAKCISGCP